MTLADTDAGSPAPQLPGLDPDRLFPYLADVFDRRLTGPAELTLLEGGSSNLSYKIVIDGASWVLRRPPLGHVMATAHDMAREHRVLAGLRDTDVPVPAPLHLCEDPDVIGAPFLLMKFVQGTAYRRAGELTLLGPARTRTISDRMIDTLVALHRVEPHEVGLGELGRAAGFLPRQVARWARQLEASSSRPLANADRLLEALRRTQPEPRRAALVHGDYRLDNLLVDDADHVAAVIDWEMATIGDPLTDLALLCVYQDLHRLDPEREPPGSSAPGFASREEQLRRYEAASKIDMSHFGFYLALAHFKLAVIVESVYFRHSLGQTTGEGFDEVGRLVEPLLAEGLAALNGS